MEAEIIINEYASVLAYHRAIIRWHKLAIEAIQCGVSVRDVYNNMYPSTPSASYIDKCADYLERMVKDKTELDGV